MIKKIMAIFAASLLCVSMVACGGSDKQTNEPKPETTAATTVATTQAPAASVEGKWTCTSATSEGVTLDAATIGIKMEIEFKSNGVVTVTDEDGSSDAKWEKTANGAKIVDGAESINVELKDDQLIMTQEGVSLFFVKK